MTWEDLLLLHCTSPVVHRFCPQIVQQRLQSRATSGIQNLMHICRHRVANISSGIHTVIFVPGVACNHRTPKGMQTARAIATRFCCSCQLTILEMHPIRANGRHQLSRSNGQSARIACRTKHFQIHGSVARSSSGIGLRTTSPANMRWVRNRARRTRHAR